MDKLTMSVQELAVHLGISKPTAYQLVRSEGFPAIQVGRRIVVPTDGFKRWLAQQAGEEGGNEV